MIAVELPAATTLPARIASSDVAINSAPQGWRRSQLIVPLLGGIFAVLAIAGLHYASKLLVPIAVSVLLTLLLGPLVRWLGKYGVAEPAGAGFLVFGTMMLLVITIAVLAAPAAQWLRRTPETLWIVQLKLKSFGPLTVLQQTAASLSQVTAGAADSVTTRVQVAGSPSPLRRMGLTTATALGAALTVAVLTYFLLASASMFRRKFAYLFPSGIHRTRMKRALYEIEEQMSRYLLINTSISLAVGLATAAFLALIDMPNPLLWGAVAVVLNFIPYLGALVTVALIGVAGLASFDTLGHALLGCGGFLAINLLEGNVLTPLVLCRKMPLNAVAVFLSLLFWGWVWGLPGVIMAVPITVMIQVICSHSERFRGVAILLGNWGSRTA
ncbi:MAG TPA: AI-2E family transporter [Gemmatimonadales bacterium]|nr:AI-2E family transporter [Gemmatimonadales bacterium]